MCELVSDSFERSKPTAFREWWERGVREMNNNQLTSLLAQTAWSTMMNTHQRIADVSWTTNATGMIIRTVEYFVKIYRAVWQKSSTLRRESEAAAVMTTLQRACLPLRSNFSLLYQLVYKTTNLFKYKKNKKINHQQWTRKKNYLQTQYWYLIWLLKYFCLYVYMFSWSLYFLFYFLARNTYTTTVVEKVE